MLPPNLSESPIFLPSTTNAVLRYTSGNAVYCDLSKYKKNSFAPGYQLINPYPNHGLTDPNVAIVKTVGSYQDVVTCYDSYQTPRSASTFINITP